MKFKLSYFKDFRTSTVQLWMTSGIAADQDTRRASSRRGRRRRWYRQNVSFPCVVSSNVPNDVPCDGLYDVCKLICGFCDIDRAIFQRITHPLMSLRRPYDVPCDGLYDVCKFSWHQKWGFVTLRLVTFQRKTFPATTHLPTNVHLEI